LAVTRSRAPDCEDTATRGYTSKGIARELTISVKTVETYVSAVLRKLQPSTRHELTRWATERRLL
jgi:DNA-binding NarL/FixJ family response regulator